MRAVSDHISPGSLDDFQGEDAIAIGVGLAGSSACGSATS